MDESEMEPKQIFDFIGYQYDLREDKARPTLERWQALSSLKIQEPLDAPSCQIRQLMSLVSSYRETSPPGPAPHETHPVAPEISLESPGITRKGDSYPKITPSAIKMVASRGKCLARSATSPTQACSSDLYRSRKRRLGCSIRRSHGKRYLVLARKQIAHKLPGTKGNLAGPKRIPRSLFKRDGAHSNRQH